MPAVSSQQRKWAFAVKGPAWAKEHHFDNPGKLPKYVHAQRGNPNVALQMFRQKLATFKRKR